jgi:hypothetical protein
VDVAAVGVEPVRRVRRTDAGDTGAVDGRLDAGE